MNKLIYENEGDITSQQRYRGLGGFCLEIETDEHDKKQSSNYEELFCKWISNY